MLYKNNRKITHCLMLARKSPKAKNIINNLKQSSKNQFPNIIMNNFLQRIFCPTDSDKKQCVRVTKKILCTFYKSHFVATVINLSNPRDRRLILLSFKTMQIYGDR